MTEPEPIIRQLDFSEYHPLDHSVWECRHYPGGKRRHIAYRWKFQWRAKAHRPLCLLGFHKPISWWRQGQPLRRTCLHCEKELPNGPVEY